MGFASKNNKTNLFARCTWENNPNALFYYNNANQAIQASSGLYPPSTGINLIRAKFNTTEGTKLYLNNSLVASNSDVSLPQNTTTNCYFNSRCNSGGFLNSKLYEYLSFTELTDNEASQVVKYLRRRYGNEANF